MRWSMMVVALLLAGSLGSVNSPGAAPDPIHASQDDLAAYVGVAQEMHGRWHALDADCDTDAVFGLLYLVTTAMVGDLVAESHFADNPYLVTWDQDFAQRYFDAYDAYHAGQSTPGPWVHAFEHGDSGRSTVTEDMLLGMNAHVNYDLVYSAYDMRLPHDGKKADYDRVNDAFWNVLVPASDEIGARYEGSQARDSQNNTPMDDAIIEVLISWRENAWNNAVLLMQTEGDPIAHAAAQAKIESDANMIAQGLRNDNGDTTGQRIAYCESSGHPVLAAHLGGPGYGDDWVSQEPPSGTDMLICHKPGSKAEKTMRVNEHAWHGHENHGDTHGPCGA